MGFDFIQLVGDEIVYEVNRASDLIRELGGRRAMRSVAATAKGKILPLRVVGRA